jgi:hypothetical protein
MLSCVTILAKGYVYVRLVDIEYRFICHVDMNEEAFDITESTTY